MDDSTEREHERVRRSYDAVAETYLERFGDELSHKPMDRALLSVLAEEAASGAGSCVADLGCGPGHVAAWLAGRGARVVGIDLSPAMVEVARASCPEAEFRQGDLLALPARDGEFGAIVCLYAIIHLVPADLPRAFDEMRRTLRPGGPCLVSFHAGDEIRHRSEWWDRPVDLDFRFFEPDAVAGLLEEAGFTVEARLERTNYPEEVATRRAYLLARRPPANSQP